MSLRNKVMGAAVAAALVGCAVPAAASAEPNVDAAVAAFKDLGLAPLTTMPSGRVVSPTVGATENYGYRTYDQINQELANLASANPSLVTLKTAPRKSVEGRDVKYVEIANNVGAYDGRPVYFMMGSIHGDEWAAGEHTMEFIYDVINTSKTNAKVKALLDKVRMIVIPVVNVDGWVRSTRANASGVDMNRNYAFGWGSNIGVTFAARGVGPSSEPEVQNTMDIVKSNQVVALLTNHNNSHAFFYPGLEVAAGFPADLDSIRGLSLAMASATNNGYTNVRDSAHDYETSGETIDWSYYATRGFAVTPETVGGSSSCNARTATNKAGKAPNYVNCTTGDYTGFVPETAAADIKAAYGGHAMRDAFYQSARLLDDQRRPLRDQRHRPGGLHAEGHQGLQPVHGHDPQQHDAGHLQPAAGRPDAPRVVDAGPGQRQVRVPREPVRAPGPAVPRRGHGPRPERLLPGELDAHLLEAGRHGRRHQDGARRQGPDGGPVAAAPRAPSAARSRRRWRSRSALRPRSARSRRASRRSTRRPPTRPSSRPPVTRR